MSFTDRFIKIPVDIVRQADENLGTKEECLCIELMRVNPLEITAYRKHYNYEGEYDDSVTVEFKNRDNMVAKLTIEEFEKLLNSFH